MLNLHEILFSPINDLSRERFIKNYSNLSLFDKKYINRKIISDKLSPIFLEYLIKKNLESTFDKKGLDNIIFQAQRFKIQNLQIIKEVIYLNELFKKENLHPVFLKGVAILNEYKDLSLRPMVDIDILFKEDEIFKAYDILKKNDYKELRFESLSKRNLLEFSKNVHHLPELIGNSNISIELHHRVTQKYDFKKCPISKSIFSDSIQIDFFGDKINIPSIDWLITHQLIHFSINSKFNNQLRVFYDLKQIEDNYDINWKSILSNDKNKKIKRSLLTSIAVINRNFVILKSFRKAKDSSKYYFPDDKTIDFYYNKSLQVYEKNLSNFLIDKVDTLIKIFKMKNIFDIFYQILSWIKFRIHIFFKLKR